MSTLLDQLIPTPRLIEVNHVDVAARPETVWSFVRHSDLARSKLVKAFFELRAIPERLTGHHQPASLSIDDLRSSEEKPGFCLLLETEPREFAVGAVGKVWQPVIPFVHVQDAAAFLDLAEPDLVKVAWAIRLEPLGDRDCRVEVEVRVDATDEQAWRMFHQYFRLIGPGSHLIRRLLLQELCLEHEPVALSPPRAA